MKAKPFNLKRSLPIAIIAGIAGTAAMTWFVNMAAKRSGSRLKVVRVLGTMLNDEAGEEGKTKNGPEEILTGTLAHYSVGIGFALSYLVLWRYRISKPDFKNSLVLGVVSGLIGAAVWRLFFYVHPRPTRTPVARYLILIFVAHLIFSISATGAFRIANKLKK